MHSIVSLRCQSELTIGEGVSQYTHGCLDGTGDSPVPCGYRDHYYIGAMTRGWSGRRADENNHRVHYLSRDGTPEAPEEGYYNCHMPDDSNPLSGLYILYPSEFLPMMYFTVQPLNDEYWDHPFLLFTEVAPSLEVKMYTSIIEKGFQRVSFVEKFIYCVLYQSLLSEVLLHSVTFLSSSHCSNCSN